jgi:hypothetical protein
MFPDCATRKLEFPEFVEAGMVTLEILDEQRPDGKI